MSNENNVYLMYTMSVSRSGLRVAFFVPACDISGTTDYTDLSFFEYISGNIFLIIEVWLQNSRNFSDIVAEMNVKKYFASLQPSYNLMPVFAIGKPIKTSHIEHYSICRSL